MTKWTTNNVDTFMFAHRNVLRAAFLLIGLFFANFVGGAVRVCL